jgi:RNA polymerase sigma-70 factor (ECF subfamily)
VKEDVPPPLTLVPRPPNAPTRAAARELAVEVVARAAKGDEAAFRALVEEYDKRVFAVVGRTLGADRAHRVEDVCQECFLRVFKALPKFDVDGPAKLSTWILTIATRLCFDELRRTKRLRDHGELDDDIAAPALTEAVALERALARRVERALASLPDDLRATFVLRVNGELSVAEAAAVLGVDEGTVKSRLNRAREKLRAAIGEV